MPFWNPWIDGWWEGIRWWREAIYLDLGGLVPGYPSCDQEVSLVSFLPRFSRSSVSSSVFLVSLVLGIQIGEGADVMS